MGEKAYKVNTKLILNWGKLKVYPGDVVYLDPDKDKDVNIPSLLKLGALEIFEPKPAEITPSSSKGKKKVDDPPHEVKEETDG
ncbi:MAG: hypothetical protein SVK08_00580 [Halobacteriota archaeon]|nr:hypothetical protein [Halobacteriota archaeon]